MKTCTLLVELMLPCPVTLTVASFEPGNTPKSIKAVPDVVTLEPPDEPADQITPFQNTGLFRLVLQAHTPAVPTLGVVAPSEIAKLGSVLNERVLVDIITLVQPHGAS